MLVFHAISCYTDENISINNTNNFDTIKNDDIFNYWKTMGSGVCDKIFLRKYWNDVEFPEGKTCEDIFVIYKLNFF